MTRLDDLARLEAAATPGPWDHGSAMCCPDRGWIDVAEAKCGSHWMREADAECIVALRNAAPHLIAIARAAQAWRMACEADALLAETALIRALDALEADRG